MRTFFLAVLTCALVVVYSCSDNASALFTSLDKDDTGITFRNTLFEDGPLNVANYIYFYNGGGVAVGDVNNDGLQDILFTGNMVKNRLFINKGNFRFEDITAQSGVAEKQGWCMGATMADVNNDGNLDIYICRSADVNPSMRTNLLFINNGNLTFTERAQEYGLADSGYSTQAAFFDYDKDGDLDCYVINHSLQKYTAGVQDNPDVRNEYIANFANKLYRNDNNHYTEVSLQSGITSNVLSFGLGIAVSDVNKDGWPDVMVSNDFNEPDYLFINNRNGTFSERLRECMDEISLYSMGSDVADYNNDGLVDIMTLDMLPEDNKTIKMHSGAENFDKFQLLFGKGYYYQLSRNMLQKNNGDGTFSEVGQLAGVSNTDWSWSALFADYDNDGYKDLFVSNGYVKDYTEMDFMKYSVDRLVRSMKGDSVDAIPDYIAKMPTNEIPNYVFRNNGDETFTKKTKEWGLDQPGVSAGAAYADLDNDGDLDLVVSNSNNYASIYRNNSEKVAKNNYLKIKLEGNNGNRYGVGAKITVYTNGRQLFQEQSPVRGYQSTVDQVLNFGLGQVTKADSVVVIWPNDQLQKLVNVTTNQSITVKQAEATGVWKYDSTAATPAPILNVQAAPGMIHAENEFNDFTTQLLLPHYLSRQGPCIVAGDVNKDGLEDVFFGGAKGVASAIYLQAASGAFTAAQQPALTADAGSEDVAAAFFDADNDGDNDLYVGSGGFEFDAKDAALQDRLYLNDGKGNFTKKPAALPAMLTSTGCVKPADIDGDGDLDLFVGGRVVPGRYPETPRSYILQNDGSGNFSDATDALAPMTRSIGMVTDAAWVDINGDKRSDLVIAGEWMPVTVLVNQAGKLQDATAAYIPFASKGWWNRILADDLDGDGDTDLLIGNCGLNTQFRVSDTEPMNIWYKDYDGNGSVDPILCYYIGGVSYPAASRDDLTDQLPSLKKKFLEYHQYAEATYVDMFTDDQRKGAGELKAELMQTIYLENQGGKVFTQRALPGEAQYAPVYGIAAFDADKDGKKDLLLTGNNTWVRIRFGRYSANHGVLLKGDGRGNYSYIPQSQSGLKIRGNVRSMQVVQSAKGPQVLAGLNNGQALIIQPAKN